MRGPHIGIRLAAVIDVVGAVSTARAVQTETAVDVTDAQESPGTRASLGFEISNPFAGVLSDLPATRKWLGREATLAVNF